MELTRTEEKKADAAGDRKEAAAPLAGNNQLEEKKAVPRKIKYTADIRLITDDFAAAETKLRELVEANKGYMAKSDVSGSPGTPRQGMWRLRVPVENFNTFCDGVNKIADVEKNSRDSEDVTMEYYDLEGRVKTRQVQLDGLRELLKKAAAEKVENMLAVLERVNNLEVEIDQIHGRLRMLANLTDLTTITVHLRERQKFDPEKRPESVEKPTFGTRASKTFDDSLENLLEMGQGLTLIAVALAPWSPFLLAFVLAVWLGFRRALKAAPVKTKPAKREGTPAADVPELPKA